jgi:hypothetical protein
LTVIPGAAAQPGFTGIHTSAIEVKQNASIELAENLRNEKSGQGPSDPSRDAQGIDGALSGTSPALDDSIDSVGEWGPWLHPHSLQEPAARDIPAHIGAVESGSTLSQSLDGQSASTVNETSSRASDPAVTLQSKNSIPATHAQGHPETVNPGPDVQSPRTPHPTPLSSEVQAQQVRKEDQANHAAAPGSLDTRIAQSKHAVTATVKAAAGVHSAMQTSPLTYSVHPQNQMEAVNPLSSAAITRSESANDLVARDAMQPQASTRSVQDPFTALDARNMRSATWLQAGAHHAEAGYLDPSLGWVSVRAESSGNALHAAIIPGSGEAAQTLGTHLTALNSFMAEHHGRSSTVTLASPDQGQMQGGLTHTGGHSGEGPAQQQLHQEESRGGILTVGSEGIPSTRTSTQHATNPPYTGGGIHISVIA